MERQGFAKETEKTPVIAIEENLAGWQGFELR
jgi:hypothetical protein